jgi:hypothetical protein
MTLLAATRVTEIPDWMTSDGQTQKARHIPVLQFSASYNFRKLVIPSTAAAKHTTLALWQRSPASEWCGGSATVPTRKVVLVPSPLREPFSSSNGLSITLQPINFVFAAAELLSGTDVQVGPHNRVWAERGSVVGPPFRGWADIFLCMCTGLVRTSERSTRQTTALEKWRR